jgi:hypothetical protein
MLAFVEQYSPIICITIVILLLILLWLFFASEESKPFVGLAPLDPKHMNKFEGPFFHPRDDVTDVLTDVVVDYTPQVETKYRAAPSAPINKSAAPPVVANSRFISRGERICCETMKRIYAVDFVTVRPDWLRNPTTGRNLELDCYNDELKLAVEYNGVQHYEFPNFTNCSYEEFIALVQRDKFKKEQCDKNGVHLITVPHTVALNKIPEYITSYLPETLQQRLQREGTLNSVYGIF